ALKVLSPDVSADKRRMLRFHQEAKVASSLNQPNILTIYEWGEVDGLTFLATEYVDGETLRDYLHDRRLKLAEILDVTMQVLAALDAAHEANIIHRDIKPENVMIRRRDHVVKVLDFGLAKVTEKGRSLASDLMSKSEAATEFKTAPGVVMGTINYMSPEQAQGHELDARTDIWSTGVMVYEMVAGTHPFKGPTTSHTIVQILEKDPPSLTQAADVPDELQRIVSKTMAKDPDERYQTAKDLLIDLRSLKKQLDLQAEIDRTSSTETQRTVSVSAGWRHLDKKRALVVALVAIAFAIAGVFGVRVWRASKKAPFVTPPAAPAAIDERTLTYWITVQKFRDGKEYQEPFTVAGEMIFEADYQIRVHVRSPQAGHLYIFNEGPETGAAPEFVIVFPTQTANQGMSLLPAGEAVQIPEPSWLRFDNERGVEKLWFVFAADAVPELEALRQFATPKTRNLITDLDQNKALKNFLTSKSSQKPTAEKGQTLTTLK
ncbi:MAG TPA: protein kinase, partial [Pyrinomonadaceae bacterium]|nr:protein kinase [Pyrinomonadaceae bacterium]